MKISNVSAMCVLCFALASAGVAQAQSARDQFNQLVAQLQTTPTDVALREKIIRLAQDLAPLPALPEEANRRMTRGMLAFKDAKSAADFQDAVTEFRQAALAAPWFADAYYNLGIAQNKANDFAAAARSLKLYLIAAPDAPDVKAAQTLLYEMEFKQEKAAKEQTADAARQAEQQAKAQQLAQRQQLVETFRGSWYGKQCFVGAMSVQSLTRGCNEKEKSGLNWSSFSTTTGDIPVFQHEVQNDGTVKLAGHTEFAGCGDVFGVPQGPSFSDIRWEERPKSGPARQVYSEINSDGNWVRISCTRPLSGANPSVGYRYVSWSRTR